MAQNTLKDESWIEKPFMKYRLIKQFRNNNNEYLIKTKKDPVGRSRS